jgi:hypothetical protein
MFRCWASSQSCSVKDVLYDQSTAVRRRLLDLRFRTGTGPRRRTIHGTIVQIDCSPTALPHTSRTALTRTLCGRVQRWLRWP